MANSKYGRIIAIASSVCAVLLGIAFIVSVLHLYLTGGEDPYSRERVGEYLTWLIVPSVITILFFIGGVVYNVITGESDVENVKRTNSDLLSSFEKRYDLTAFDGNTVAAVTEEKKKVKVLNICFHLISALLFVIAFVYIAFIAELTVEQLNADIIAAFAVVLPLAAIGVTVQIPRIYLLEGSAGRQLQLMKESIKENGAPEAKSAKTNEAKVDYAVIVKYALLGLSLVLVILGIFNGGMADVLAKAVKICTECIGLG